MLSTLQACRPESASAWAALGRAAVLLAGLGAFVPAPASAGAWILGEVKIDKPTLAQSPCYPGRAMELADGSARFVQGYADCTGEGRVKGGEKAETTIRWSFSQPTARLEPGKPLVATIRIDRRSDPVPYYGGGSAVFYFRSQSAVGVVELKGFLTNRDLPTSVTRDVRLDRVPDGREGDTLTMWMNVGGESGLGDVFYSYKYRENAVLPAPPVPAAAKDPADPRCARYGLDAAAQAEDNRARGCGYTGERWQPGFLPHAVWCLRAEVTEADLVRETEARRAAIAACRPGTVAPPPPPPAPPPPAIVLKDSGARFSSLTGEVEVRHDDETEWRFVKLNTVLHVGDHVRTGEDSSAIVGFADLSTFLVKAETEVVITTPPEKDSKLRLVVGNIIHNVKKMWKDGTMEVEMSQAVAGIKGTVFSTASSPAEGDVAAVFEGAIELRSRATGRRMRLERGERVRIGPHGFSPVERFDPETELAAVTAEFPARAVDEIRRRVAAGPAAPAPAPRPPVPSAAPLPAPGAAPAAPPPASPSRPDPVPAPGAAAGDQGGAPSGYWGVSEGADGVKIGVIVPDYSPNEYVGAVFFCIRQGVVRAAIDSPRPLPAGRAARVTLSADGNDAAYRGKAEDNAAGDGSVVVFETGFNDPVFQDLAAATRIDLAVDGRRVPLPTRNARRAFGEFAEKCRH